MNAVAVSEFSMFQTVVKVHLVFLEVTLLVRFLNTAACRGIIMGYGEPNHGTVGEIHGALYQTLTKGAAAYDGSTVLILNGA